MTPSQIEALHTALTHGTAQMDETAAALREAARLLGDCSLFAHQSAALQTQIEEAWLPLMASLQAHCQALSTALLDETSSR